MPADIIKFFYSSVQNWSIKVGRRNCPKFSAVLLRAGDENVK
jgi:hypothetical protein